MMHKKIDKSIVILVNHLMCKSYTLRFYFIIIIIIIIIIFIYFFFQGEKW